MRSRIRASIGDVFRRARCVLPGAGLILALQPAAWFRFGIGITVAGAGVSVWADQSGNGRDLKQGTDTNRPALQVDGSILFDGSDNYLKCDAFTLNQPITVYVLGRQITFSAGDTFTDGNGLNTLGIQQVTAQPQLRLRNSGATGTTSDLPLNTYGVLAGVFSGANSLLQVNNGTPVTGNPGTDAAGGFTLGAGGTAGSNFINAQYKEVILFPVAHDAATRARVIRYLAGVGGL